MTIQLDPSRSPTLGADLRALRKTRGLTLQDLADALGRSVGWLSQVERDLSQPSIEDLRHLANVLGVSVSMLARHAPGDATEAGYVVRKDLRRPIGSRVSGLVEELLSPDLTDAFEMVHSTFEPGAAISETVTRPTQELGYLIAGQLDVTIAERTYVIQPGDSFRLRGEPFRWANPYTEPAIAIWVIAPPIY